MTDLTYSKEILKRFQNPKFVKSLKKPNGMGEVGNIKCGDVMHLEIEVEKDKIKDIGFKTFGCPSAIASSEVVCEIAKGKTLKQAEKLTNADVVKKLKGMPPTKIHCSVLGIEALQKAIKNYKKRNLI